jgi:predicted transcriptional regulator YdeE
VAGAIPIKRLQSAPDFECYGESFDPQKGTGGVEIWIPVNA